MYYFVRLMSFNHIIRFDDNKHLLTADFRVLKYS